MGLSKPILDRRRCCLYLSLSLSPEVSPDTIRSLSRPILPEVVRIVCFLSPPRPVSPSCFSPHIDISPIPYFYDPSTPPHPYPISFFLPFRISPRFASYTSGFAAIIPGILPKHIFSSRFYLTAASYWYHSRGILRPTIKVSLGMDSPWVYLHTPNEY